MQKPEHDQDCTYINRPWSLCPACVWEGAVEAALTVVEAHLRVSSYAKDQDACDAIVRDMRERVK